MIMLRAKTSRLLVIQLRNMNHAHVCIDVDMYVSHRIITILPLPTCTCLDLVSMSLDATGLNG